MAARAPILWHIEVSHFSEKARWALEHKSVEHERRAPLPGLHIALALWLTRGSAYTLPILELEGSRIAGSDAIIEALEQRFPERPLLPSEPSERARALALEHWFDSELGPYTRRLAFYELGRDRDRLAEVSERLAPDLARRMGRAGLPFTRALVALRYRAADARAAQAARAKVLAAFDRLEAELGERDYLVGDRFTVADLTAAALLFPVVLPPQAPFVATSMPEPYERFREPLRARRGYRWVQEMFQRHRNRPPSPADHPRPQRAAHAVSDTR